MLLYNKITQDGIGKEKKNEKIEAFGVGEQITVSFNLRGREWKEKFFNTLEAWKVQGIF